MYKTPWKQYGFTSYAHYKSAVRMYWKYVDLYGLSRKYKIPYKIKKSDEADYIKFHQSLYERVR